MVDGLSLVCENGHRFDVARQGYVNLLGPKDKRSKEITLPGKGHSVLTLDFVDEAGHPTRAALDNVIAYFGKQLTAAD